MRLSSAYLVFLVAYVANAAPLNVTSIQSPPVATRAVSTPELVARSATYEVTIISPEPIMIPGGKPDELQVNIKSAVEQTMKQGQWVGDVEMKNTLHKLQAKGQKVTFEVQGPSSSKREGSFTAKDNGVLDATKAFGMEHQA
ncbi:hypothetical protein BDP27DRAFT_1431939 [Rhodocollybia butyracea]|uniref:Uncharacterized protein n=1 Tax=Rhodocollybia butyracea TaxID=206335 RepID=A0A9P5P9G9_9AGAR|nr:hypothetical protein BDP27DRAFT_1431939 [Rhodocollybia butyracea]